MPREAADAHAATSTTHRLRSPPRPNRCLRTIPSGEEEQRRPARPRRDPAQAAAEDRRALRLPRRASRRTPAPRAPAWARPSAAALVFIILLIVAVWLASGFYIVDEGRRGVVLRLGKYLETTQPGPRWHIPYPIETRRGRERLGRAHGRSGLSRQPARTSSPRKRSCSPTTRTSSTCSSPSSTR